MQQPYNGYPGGEHPPNDEKAHQLELAEQAIATSTTRLVANGLISEAGLAAADVARIDEYVRLHGDTCLALGLGHPVATLDEREIRSLQRFFPDPATRAEALAGQPSRERVVDGVRSALANMRQNLPYPLAHQVHGLILFGSRLSHISVPAAPTIVNGQVVVEGSDIDIKPIVGYQSAREHRDHILHLRSSLDALLHAQSPQEFLGIPVQTHGLVRPEAFRYQLQQGVFDNDPAWWANTEAPYFVGELPAINTTDTRGNPVIAPALAEIEVNELLQQAFQSPKAAQARQRLAEEARLELGARIADRQNQQP